MKRIALFHGLEMEPVMDFVLFILILAWICFYGVPRFEAWFERAMLKNYPAKMSRRARRKLKGMVGLAAALALAHPLHAYQRGYSQGYIDVLEGK